MSEPRGPEVQKNWDSRGAVGPARTSPPPNLVPRSSGAGGFQLVLGVLWAPLTAGLPGSGPRKDSQGSHFPPPFSAHVPVTRRARVAGGLIVPLTGGETEARGGHVASPAPPPATSLIPESSSSVAPFLPQTSLLLCPTPSAHEVMRCRPDEGQVAPRCPSPVGGLPAAEGLGTDLAPAGHALYKVSEPWTDPS